MALRDMAAAGPNAAGPRTAQYLAELRERYRWFPWVEPRYMQFCFRFTFSPDGQQLAYAKDIATYSAHGIVFVQDIIHNTLLELPRESPRHAIWSLEFSPDGRHIAANVDEGGVRVYDLAKREAVAALPGAATGAIAFSHDGRRLASGSDCKGVVRVFTLDEGGKWRGTAVLKGHNETVIALVFSHDGRLLMSGSRDHTARVWDVAEGTLVAVLTGHRKRVRNVAFSPDNRMVATASFDRTVRLWELPTGRAVRTFRGHMDEVWSVAISPDGTQLASGSRDRTVRLWDIATGRCLRWRVSPGDAETLQFPCPGLLRAEVSHREVSCSFTYHSALTPIFLSRWTPEMHRHLPRLQRLAVLAFMCALRRLGAARRGGDPYLLPPELVFTILEFVFAGSAL